MCNNKNKYINIQTGEDINLDEVKKLKDNAMLKVRPDLWCEWDFKKNNELGLDIYKVSKGMKVEAWWICPKCKSSYDSTINNRRQSACPYCVGRKVNSTNSLSTINPDLASQWHPIKNGEMTPNDVTCNKNIKVWWQCEFGHEWEARVADRSSGRGCPYCSNNKIWVGFNDMWTTNPELASLLADPEDGYKYMQCSGEKINWKCSDCGELIKNKRIVDVNKCGLPCPVCSDGVKYPEKFMYNLLKQLDVKFEFQKSFDWLNNRKYDFYLSDLNTIIETHGGQHTVDRGFERTGGRTIEEEQENDRLKERLARENGIEYYIVIDARKSELEWIKDSVMNSGLSGIIDFSKVNWDGVHRNSLNSFVKLACDLWSKGMRSASQIGNVMKLSRVTINKYLKTGEKIGWCNYYAINERKVVKLDMNSEYVEEYLSLSYAERKSGIKYNNISACCRRVSKTAGGYKWMYKEDYEKYIEEQKQIA